MNDTHEYWIFVPKTQRRYAVSNKGQLMKVARKRRYARKIILEGCLELVPIVSDYKSGALGWYAWFDGESHFFKRDELMELFPQQLLDIDRSMDEAAIAKREATFNEALGRAMRDE